MRIGSVELGKLPITVGTVCSDLNISSETLEQIDVFEIRIDMLEKQFLDNPVRVINSIRQRYDKPLILTVRSKLEGGITSFADDARYEIFKNAISIVDAIDVELSSPELMKRVANLCKENKKLLIASYHNFTKTPEYMYMENLVQNGKKMGADIIKIAVKSNNFDDVANLIEFTIKNREEGLITISLGNIGLITRIVNPVVGSLMTYGFIDMASSPGQISIFDCIEHLRLFVPQFNEHLIEKTHF